MVMQMPETCLQVPPVHVSAPSRRVDAGLAVVSIMERRRRLIDGLNGAGIQHRILLLQYDDTGIAPPPDVPLLPPLRAPLLLDTGGLSPVYLTILLEELATKHADTATIALVRPTDQVALTLISACPSIYAVAPDTMDLALLHPWVIHVGMVGQRRHADVDPVYLNTPPPHHLFASPVVLTILTALARAKTMEEAAAASPLPSRTFYRRLRALRAQLGLPSPEECRYRPADLLASLLTAIAEDTPDYERSRT